MLDIKRIRENPEAVHEALLKRNCDYDFTEFLGWDKQRRELIGKVEEFTPKPRKKRKSLLNQTVNTLITRR